MELEVSPNEMSKEELQQVTQGCVQFLQRHSASSFSTNTRASVSQPAAASHDSQHDITPQPTPRVFNSHDIQAAAAAASSAGSDSELQASVLTATDAASRGVATQAFTSTHPEVRMLHRPEGETERQPDREQPVADHVHMAYLVTALLCLCMAPRSQVLRQLRIGSSLVKEADGKYWVRLLADMCKNGKPTLFAVPELLTSAMDYYLTHVRPRMVARQAAAAWQVELATAAGAGAAAADGVSVTC